MQKKGETKSIHVDGKLHILYEIQVYKSKCWLFSR